MVDMVNPVLVRVVGWVYDGARREVEGASIRFTSDNEFFRDGNHYNIDEEVLSDGNGHFTVELPSTRDSANVLSTVTVEISYPDNMGNDVFDTFKIIVPAREDAVVDQSNHEVLLEDIKVSEDDEVIIFSGARGPKGERADTGRRIVELVSTTEANLPAGSISGAGLAWNKIIDGSGLNISDDDDIELIVTTSAISKRYSKRLSYSEIGVYPNLDDIIVPYTRPDFILSIGSSEIFLAKDNEGSFFVSSGETALTNIPIELNQIIYGRGLQGVQGIEGPIGPRGPVGPEGPEGPEGPAGPATEATIPDGSIDTDALADRSVSTVKVKDRNLTEEKLADNSVSSRTIRTKTILSRHFDYNSVARTIAIRTTDNRSATINHDVDCDNKIDGIFYFDFSSPERNSDGDPRELQITTQNMALGATYKFFIKKSPDVADVVYLNLPDRHRVNYISSSSNLNIQGGIIYVEIKVIQIDDDNATNTEALVIPLGGGDGGDINLASVLGRSPIAASLNDNDMFPMLHEQDGTPLVHLSNLRSLSDFAFLGASVERRNMTQYQTSVDLINPSFNYMLFGKNLVRAEFPALIQGTDPIVVSDSGYDFDQMRFNQYTSAASRLRKVIEAKEARGPNDDMVLTVSSDLSTITLYSERDEFTIDLKVTIDLSTRSLPASIDTNSPTLEVTDTAGRTKTLRGYVWRNLTAAQIASIFTENFANPTSMMRLFLAVSQSSRGGEFQNHITISFGDAWYQTTRGTQALKLVSEQSVVEKFGLSTDAKISPVNERVDDINERVDALESASPSNSDFSLVVERTTLNLTIPANLPAAGDSFNIVVRAFGTANAPAGERFSANLGGSPVIIANPGVALTEDTDIILEASYNDTTRENLIRNTARTHVLPVQVHYGLEDSPITTFPFLESVITPSTWARTGNNDAIPAAKLTNAPMPVTWARTGNADRIPFAKSPTPMFWQGNSAFPAVASSTDRTPDLTQSQINGVLGRLARRDLVASGVYKLTATLEIRGRNTNASPRQMRVNVQHNRTNIFPNDLFTGGQGNTFRDTISVVTLTRIFTAVGTDLTFIYGVHSNIYRVSVSYILERLS